MAGDNMQKLPEGWKKKESRSKPGRFYYANVNTGISVWKLEDVFKDENSSTVTSSGGAKPVVSQTAKSDKKSTSHNETDRTVLEVKGSSAAGSAITNKRINQAHLHRAGERLKSSRQANRPTPISTPARPDRVSPTKLHKPVESGTPALKKTIGELEKLKSIKPTPISKHQTAMPVSQLKPSGGKYEH